MPENSKDAAGIWPSPAELYLQTHEALKREIAASVDDARSAERNALLIVGGICAFLAERCQVQADALIWKVPLLIAIFFAFRVLFLMISIKPRADYLVKIETAVYGGCDLPGWERYFRSQRKITRMWVGASMVAFWSLLIVATYCGPGYLLKERCTSPAHASESIYEGKK